MAGCLLVYAPSARGDAALRDALRSGEPVAVVALAPEERPKRACCGIQSTYWNGVQRELAEQELTRARLAVEDAPSDAVTLGAERIVLADPRASGLGRRAVKRLRGRSPAPVAA